MPNELDLEDLTEAERCEAVARAMRACAMCSTSYWPALAQHMAEPGVAVAMGAILSRYPEPEWASIVEGAVRRSALLMEILASKLVDIVVVQIPLADDRN